MPFVAKNGSGPNYREYGICNGTRCRLKVCELDEKDTETVQRQHMGEEFIILQTLPKILYVEVETGLKRQDPGLPKNWFAMKTVETHWMLDTSENIEILRLGFPLMPNFSTTIDGASGQTLRSSIADLGEFGSVPSHSAAMRGYIALSRVTAADTMLIARSFSPLLFKLGAQPFPTLLFNELHREKDKMKDGDLVRVCFETVEENKGQKRY